jgi:hypothetical protein
MNFAVTTINGPSKALKSTIDHGIDRFQFKLSIVFRHLV